MVMEWVMKYVYFEFFYFILVVVKYGDVMIMFLEFKMENFINWIELFCFEE